MPTTDKITPPKAFGSTPYERAYLQVWSAYPKPEQVDRNWIQTAANSSFSQRSGEQFADWLDRLLWLALQPQTTQLNLAKICAKILPSDPALRDLDVGQLQMRGKTFNAIASNHSCAFEFALDHTTGVPDLKTLEFLQEIGKMHHLHFVELFKGRRREGLIPFLDQMNKLTNLGVLLFVDSDQRNFCK